jgi:hypothetical protein
MQMASLSPDGEYRSRNSKKSLQCVADKKFKRILHPPYSPDLESSPFYLFSTVKQRLQICEGQSFKELQKNVDEMLSSIGLDELEAIRQGWIKRLRRVIALSGEHAWGINS